MNIDEINLTLPKETRLPKYQLLADLLGNWIADNHPAGGTRLPSERSLADSWGTTPVTVSKCLDILVRKGILARRAGSGTYIAGRGISSRILRIGMVAHEPMRNDDCYVSFVQKAFYEYWTGRNADLISLIRTPDEYEQAIREYNLAGIMVLAPQEEYVPKLQELIGKGVPLVTVGVCLPELGSLSFGTEHSVVCEQAIAYLRDRGHTRIGLLNPNPSSSATRERENGYLRGMWKAKLPVNPDWIIRGPQNLPTSPDALIRQLTAPEHLSAILLTSHSMILPLYDLCRTLNLQIPGDISIIAFDDPPSAAQLTPPMTVFAQPVEDFTRLAAQQLERLILHEEPFEAPPSEAVLIERGSCRSLISETISDKSIKKTSRKGTVS